MANMEVITTKQMSELVRLNIERGLMDSFAFLGLGGIGKTQSMYELTKELGIGYVDIRLLQYNITDFKGIPFKSDIEGFTKFLISDLFPRKATEHDDPTDPRFQEKGILVLDEITSCTTSLRTVMYQLVNERCLGEYKLPEGWIIVMLGNGINDGGDFNGIEGNLLNRCFSYRVKAVQSDFEDYIVNKYPGAIGSLVASYLGNKPDHLHTFNSEAVDEDDLVFASSRSWERVCKLLQLDKTLETELKLSDYTKLLIQGAIGNNVAFDFFAYMERYTKMPKAKDILDGMYDLESSKNAYHTKVKGESSVDGKIEIISNIKSDKAKEFALALETARDKALGTVLVNSLFDNILLEYSNIPKESFQYYRLNKELDSTIDNFLDRFINACNFVADYLKGDILRLFIMLVTKQSMVSNIVKDLHYSDYMSILILHKKSMNPKINRANIAENGLDYLLVAGLIDRDKVEFE